MKLILLHRSGPVILSFHTPLDTNHSNYPMVTNNKLFMMLLTKLSSISRNIVTHRTNFILHSELISCHPLSSNRWGNNTRNNTIISYHFCVISSRAVVPTLPLGAVSTSRLVRKFAETNRLITYLHSTEKKMRRAKKGGKRIYIYVCVCVWWKTLKELS
jgi:hypothetical protein